MAADEDCAPVRSPQRRQGAKDREDFYMCFLGLPAGRYLGLVTTDYKEMAPQFTASIICHIFKIKDPHHESNPEKEEGNVSALSSPCRAIQVCHVPPAFPPEGIQPGIP